LLVDPIALLAAIPYVGPYIPYITLGVTICAYLCTVLPPPAATTGTYYVIYQVITKIAANFGRAQSLNAPESVGMIGGPVANAAGSGKPFATPVAPITPPPADPKK
jgi:hypothetical protein